MSAWTPGERGIVALAAEMAPSVHNTRPWGLQSAWTAADEHPVAGAGVAVVPRRDAALPWAGLVRRSTAVPDVEIITDRLQRECLLLVETPDDGPLDQVRAGMAAQTAWLTATDARLVGSVLTQPLQLPEVRAGLVEALSLAGFPQLLLRLGHPQIDHEEERPT